MNIYIYMHFNTTEYVHIYIYRHEWTTLNVSSDIAAATHALTNTLNINCVSYFYIQMKHIFIYIHYTNVHINIHTQRKYEMVLYTFSPNLNTLPMNHDFLNRFFEFPGSAPRRGGVLLPLTLWKWYCCKGKNHQGAAVIVLWQYVVMKADSFFIAGTTRTTNAS